jgi:hypothetical protein
MARDEIYKSKQATLRGLRALSPCRLGELHEVRKLLDLHQSSVGLRFLDGKD